jgi:hypothetical protein
MNSFSPLDNFNRIVKILRPASIAAAGRAV